MSTLNFLFILCFLKSSHSEFHSTPKQQSEDVNGETRRILHGAQIFDTRPYMVYLRPTLTDNHLVDHNWVCGGVIIDEWYIVTSAACIEDVTYFYVVSGTNRWLPPTETNECIQNGAMRAFWKCIPRTYNFDGNYFNNIRWMVNDIAVVKTEDQFNFYRRIKGCDFIPQKILYNNISKDLEDPGQVGFIAGWGSTLMYTDSFDKSSDSDNSRFLMEARTVIIQKSNCKRYWDRRYHAIIDKYMMCGKRGQTMIMTDECEMHATCRQLLQQEELGPRSRRFENNPDKLLLNSAAHVRKREKIRKMKTRRLLSDSGGFCENDHGGPLSVGHGKNRILVGIISAYMIKNASKQCYGPYLYTSVYNNRFLIECALYKDLPGKSCSTVLRDVSAVLEEQTFDWGTITPRSYLYEENNFNTREVLEKSNANNSETTGSSGNDSDTSTTDGNNETATTPSS